MFRESQPSQSSRRVPRGGRNRASQPRQLVPRGTQGRRRLSRAGRYRPACPRTPRDRQVKAARISRQREPVREHVRRASLFRQIARSRVDRAVTGIVLRAIATAEIKTTREAVRAAVPREAVTESGRADTREGTEAVFRAKAIREAVMETAPRAREAAEGLIREAVTGTAKVATREGTGTVREAKGIREAATETVPKVREAVREGTTATGTVQEASRAATGAVQAVTREGTGTVREASRAVTEGVPRAREAARREGVRDRRTFPSPLTRLLRQNPRATEAIKMPIRMINMIKGI